MKQSLEAPPARISHALEALPSQAGRSVADVAAYEEPDVAEPVVQRPSLKRRLGVLAAAVALVVGSGVGVRSYLHARGHESTDDAFVEGRIVQMSPRVSGHVARVLVNDNQHVEAGQVVVELDARDYQARLDQARAALESAKGKRAAARAQLDLVKVTSAADVSQAKAGEQQARSGVGAAKAQVTAACSLLTEADARVAAAEAAVEEAKADVSAADAEKVRAATEFKRFEQMHVAQVASDQELANMRAVSRTADARSLAASKKVVASEAAVTQARAAKASAVAALAQAESQVGQATAKLEEARAHVEGADVAPQRVRAAESDLQMTEAEVDRLAALVHQAELDLSYTRIAAPEAGRVTRKAVEEGNYVQPGQAMFALVPDDMWVVANFKENQLDHIRPGQPVDVKIDAYPDLHVKAHVDSIQRGTGARFSLLPPENATGNYVKVVQRVPVKIVFDQAPADKYPIGPGMSAEPEVSVK